MKSRDDDLSSSIPHFLVMDCLSYVLPLRKTRPSRAPVLALAVSAIFRGVRRQREAAKEANQAQRNDAEAERHTQPLQDISHRTLGISIEICRGRRQLVQGVTSRLDFKAWLEGLA
jgi:hypothetical protein